MICLMFCYHSPKQVALQLLEFLAPHNLGVSKGKGSGVKLMLL